MDSTLRISMLIFVLMVFVPSLAQPWKEVACATCIYVEFNIRNVPSLVKRLVGTMLSGMELSNQECASNKISPKTCNRPLIPFLMENKCTKAKLNLNAVGLKSIFPDAELNVGVIVRACKPVMYGTADKCETLSELGAVEMAELTNQLKTIESQWNRVTYSGNVCTRTPLTERIPVE